LEAHAAKLERRRYSIHFHCWTAGEFAAQLERLLPTLTPRAAVVEQRTNNHEFLVALRQL
jgi:hypothetical protein